jgi:hypothetical protein
MLDMLRRRIRDYYPELMKTTPPAEALYRAESMLKEIWTMSGESGKKHPTWRLVESVIRMGRDYLAKQTLHERGNHLDRNRRDQAVARQYTDESGELGSPAGDSDSPVVEV